MHNSLHFTTFDLLRDAPELCGLCEARPPVFHFEFNSDAYQEKPFSRKGFCCEVCATRLLKKLERTESQEWAEEEAALAAEDLDTDEFHKRLESLRAVVGLK
jgi:ferredoxin